MHVVTHIRTPSHYKIPPASLVRPMVTCGKKSVTNSLKLPNYVYSFLNGQRTDAVHLQDLRWTAAHRENQTHCTSCSPCWQEVLGGKLRPRNGYCKYKVEGSKPVAVARISRRRSTRDTDVAEMFCRSVTISASTANHACSGPKQDQRLDLTIKHRILGSAFHKSQTSIGIGFRRMVLHGALATLVLKIMCRMIHV